MNEKEYTNDHDYDGYHLAGGWEYEMTCPKCDKYIFVSNGMGRNKEIEYDRSWNDMIDSMNAEIIKVGGEYFCPYCTTKFKLKFEEKEVDNFEKLDSCYIDVNDNYNRHKSVHKVKDVYYTMKYVSSDLVEHNIKPKDKDNFKEIPESIYNIRKDDWKDIVKSLECESDLRVSIGDYIVNKNGVRGEIVGKFKDSNNDTVVQIKYKNVKYKAEEKLVGSKLYYINEEAYEIDNDVWENYIIDIFDKSYNTVVEE